MLAQQSDYTATAQKDVVTVSKFLYKSNKTEIPCGCVCDDLFEVRPESRSL